MAMIDLQEVNIGLDYLDVIENLVRSNNDLELRLRALEPKPPTLDVRQQSLPLDEFAPKVCKCQTPMHGLGSKDCLRCGFPMPLKPETFHHSV